MDKNDGDPEYELVAVYSGEYATKKWYEPDCSVVAGRANSITRSVWEWINKLRTMNSEK